MTTIEVKPTRKRKVKEWIPPSAEDFRHGRVIGVDQSLSASGVVALVCDEFGLRVVTAEVLRTVPVAVGGEDSLQRAIALAGLFRRLLGDYSPEGWPVAHEAPPLTGLQIGTRLGTQRPESSWLSALALRMVLAERGITMLPMVDGRRWKKIVSGNGAAKKTDAHKLMSTWAPTVIGGMKQITNEAKRDGLAVALASLWRHP